MKKHINDFITLNVAERIDYLNSLRITAEHNELTDFIIGTIAVHYLMLMPLLMHEKESFEGINRKYENIIPWAEKLYNEALQKKPIVPFLQMYLDLYNHLNRNNEEPFN